MVLLSPALSVRENLSTSHPLMSQRKDVYSSAKLLAVLIIHPAAGGVCQVSLRLLLMDTEQDTVKADGAPAPHQPVCFQVCVFVSVCVAYSGASTLHAVFIWT